MGRAVWAALRAAPPSRHAEGSARAHTKTRKHESCKAGSQSRPNLCSQDELVWQSWARNSESHNAPRHERRTGGGEDGYDTEFRGRFLIEPVLRAKHAAYPAAFSRTQRIKRDAARTVFREDPVRLATGLPVGEDGGYFVGDTGEPGDGAGADVLDANHPPSGQPELWYHWAPTPDGSAIVWDGRAKFYEYERWLAYLIQHFLAPWDMLWTEPCNAKARTGPSRVISWSRAIGCTSGRQRSDG